MRKEIGIDKKSIQAVFRKDCILLAVFLTAMWCVLMPVLMAVLELTNDGIVKGLMTGIAFLSGGALTWAMIAVFLHIRNNKLAIYTEELQNQALAVRK